MEGNIFGIVVTVFSNDIKPADALLSFAGQFEPWALKTMEKLKNNESVQLLRHNNYYIFLDELEYHVNENKDNFI